MLLLKIIDQGLKGSLLSARSAKLYIDSFQYRYSPLWQDTLLSGKNCLPPAINHIILKETDPAAVHGSLFLKISVAVQLRKEETKWHRIQS